MDIGTLHSLQNSLILWIMLLLAHPTQTTLLNDIFWASKSTFHTGMYLNHTMIFTLVLKMPPFIFFNTLFHLYLLFIQVPLKFHIM